MTAHFQRVQQAQTLGEVRFDMHLPEYPIPMLDAAPLNPSFGALYQQVLMVPPEGSEAGEGGSGDASEPGEGGPEGASEPGKPSILAQKLQDLGEGRTPYQPMEFEKQPAEAQE
jgi:hypothetical protein